MFGILTLPKTVIFGPETARLLGSTAKARGTRPGILMDPYLPDELRANLLDSLQSAGLETAILTPPTTKGSSQEATEQLARQAMAAACDVVIAVGGGSTLDLGKLLSLRLAHGSDWARFVGESLIPGPTVPWIALPTTAGTGSEISPVAVVIGEDGNKATISSRWLVASAVISDPLMTHSCPRTPTAHAGLDALVNAIESFLTPYRATQPTILEESIFVGNSPFTKPLAGAAILSIAGSLGNAVADGSDAQAREQMALGSLQAALAYSQSGTGIVHALAYPLEAITKVPHGLAVGLLLPAVLAYTAMKDPAAIDPLSSLMGLENRPALGLENPAVSWIVELNRECGLPPSLSDLRVTREDLQKMAQDAIRINRLVRNSPVPVQVEDLRDILALAY